MLYDRWRKTTVMRYMWVCLLLREQYCVDDFPWDDKAWWGGRWQQHQPPHTLLAAPVIRVRLCDTDEGLVAMLCQLTAALVRKAQHTNRHGSWLCSSTARINEPCWALVYRWQARVLPPIVLLWSISFHCSKMPTKMLNCSPVNCSEEILARSMLISLNMAALLEAV